MIDFHQILGVRYDATSDEIRKAYRTRAFNLHPDRNKDPEAHEQFIQLTIAYEYLLSGKKVPKAQEAYTTQRPPQPAQDTEEFRYWKEMQRRKAEELAKVRYEDFKRRNDAFKRTAMYPIVKVVTLLTILACGCLALGFCSLPIVILVSTRDPVALLSCFYVFPGYYAYKGTLEMIETYRVHY